jgi:hypothetical protein
MAKAFAAILTNRLSFDSLPWHFEEGDAVEEVPSDAIMYPERSCWGTSLPLSVFASSGSMISNSVIEQTLAGPDAAAHAVFSTHMIDVHLRLERLMFALQDFLNRSGYA